MSKVWTGIGQYAKGIVVVAGSIVTALTPYYANAHWFPAVTTAITAITVILVPNANKPS